MKYCIIRKVPYRIGAGRIVWALVLAERDGLALLFVPTLTENGDHFLAIALESGPRQIFEDVPAARFTMTSRDLVAIAARLQAVGEDLVGNEDFRRLFEGVDEL